MITLGPRQYVCNILKNSTNPLKDLLDVRWEWIIELAKEKHWQRAELISQTIRRFEREIEHRFDYKFKP